MNHIHNSSALTRQISEKLKLTEEDTKKLYEELSQLNNGLIKDILDKLTAKDTKPNKKYAACIRSSCVRDAQYSKQFDADHMDDEAWFNSDGELFLGIIEAETPIKAKQITATYAMVDEDVIELFDFDKDIGLFHL